ncbi:LPXTG cell wall anchor domain-containing protein [Staphylococcus croceilyticus]|uniref:LPXTG cell wall anchor domain-containing protein n=1 Tax=Staphylococcus croceilyticus TaxID=319942 RepID=A0ABY2KER8_9STAP|nr:LPXTG cell wall anchor domain-containing protein [Staphylococcus croceilyticus]TGA73517.1 LPXTG cell wall anchor domain-containing protein [Staphylococcus croceilyticus]
MTCFDTSDSDSDNELPETGENDNNNGLLIGSLFAGLGSLLLGKRRRKNNKN